MELPIPGFVPAENINAPKALLDGGEEV